MKRTVAGILTLLGLGVLFDAVAAGALDARPLALAFYAGALAFVLGTTTRYELARRAHEGAVQRWDGMEGMDPDDK